VPQIAVSGVERKPRSPWLSWVATTDHKRIGVLYLATAFAFLMVAPTLPRRTSRQPNVGAESDRSLSRSAALRRPTAKVA